MRTSVVNAPSLSAAARFVAPGDPTTCARGVNPRVGVRYDNRFGYAFSRKVIGGGIV
jgi:hypothetical protein